MEDLEIRRLHANLIADARKTFPTREALEVCIRERRQEVERAVNSRFEMLIRKQLACAALADDEVRKLSTSTIDSTHGRRLARDDSEKKLKGILKVNQKTCQGTGTTILIAEMTSKLRACVQSDVKQVTC